VRAASEFQIWRTNRTGVHRCLVVATRAVLLIGSTSWSVRAGNPHRLIRGSLGFAFADRDDLEIVADRLQNKCFVDRAGRIRGAVTQLVSERKRHSYTLPVLRDTNQDGYGRGLDYDIAGEPKMPFRPACRVVL